MSRTPRSWVRPTPTCARAVGRPSPVKASPKKPARISLSDGGLYHLVEEMVTLGARGGAYKFLKYQDKLTLTEPQIEALSEQVANYVMVALVDAGLLGEGA